MRNETFDRKVLRVRRKVREMSKITRDDDEEPFKVRLMELTCLIRLRLNRNDLFNDDVCVGV
jgi:hypothetical protein